MDVAITGATGLVGSRLVELLGSRHRFVPLERSQGWDLSQPDPAKWTRRLPDADVLLHAAARTDVDAIETERFEDTRGDAFVTNTVATGLLARVAHDHGMPFVFVSTDYVFPAAARGPFREDRRPAQSPEETNWYGWTKLVAERELAAEGIHHTIVRIASPYRAHYARRTDLARRILERYATGNPLPLFEDQAFTPTFVDDLAQGVDAILSRKLRGIVHWTCGDATTPYDFGAALLRAAPVPNAKPVRGSFADFQKDNRTPRPARGGLVTSRGEEMGRIPAPVAASVDEFARQWRVAAASFPRS